MAGFDGLERVIQIGVYLQDRSAAIRCGYIAVRAGLGRALGRPQARHLPRQRPPPRNVLHHLLTDGTYRRHLEALQAQAVARHGPDHGQADGAGLEPFTEPRVGTFIWARLPGRHRCSRVARRALADDMIFAPGNVFSASHSAAGYMRFNVARCGDPRVFDVSGADIDDAWLSATGHARLAHGRERA